MKGDKNKKAIKGDENGNHPLLKKEEGSENDLESKCEEYLQGWKRALADYENLKRDLSQQKTEDRDRIKASFALDLLPVVDNFDQALKHAPEMDDPSFKGWMEGVTFIRKQFTLVLVGLGLVEIEVGDVFDVDTMDIASERSEDDKEDGAILEVVASGWKMGDQVVRATRVVINKK
mgnify:FL=1|jgi:molecular chaperone GrpE